MDHRRKNERIFDYYVLTVLAIIFIIIVEIMGRGTAKDAVLPILGGALSVDLGLIGLAAAHLWNAQKKDEVSNRSAIPPIDKSPTPVEPKPAA